MEPALMVHGTNPPLATEQTTKTVTPVDEHSMVTNTQNRVTTTRASAIPADPTRVAQNPASKPAVEGGSATDGHAIAGDQTGGNSGISTPAADNMADKQSKLKMLLDEFKRQ